MSIIRRLPIFIAPFRSAFCTIYDIALLFECEQIIDVDMKRCHPTWTAVNHLAEVKIPDGLFHRSRMGSHLEIRALVEKDMSI